MKHRAIYFFRKRLFFIFLLALSNYSLAQTTSSCTNSDFELGNLSNWNGEIGWCCPITTGSSGIINGRHTIMTGGIDPYSLGQIPKVFPGGTYSARLGNDLVNSEAEKLKYTFNVTSQTDLFIYRYAVILQDPGHPTVDQPRFQISVQDQSGQPIGCGTYNVVADSTIPGFQNNGIIRFKTWTTIGIDLSSYIGQTVTIIFATGDCAQGAHFGYAYLDCYCSPLQISSDLCPESNVVNLTAPVGFASYLWSDGQTTSSITINNPVLGTTYSVTMTSVTGCSVTLSTTVAPTYTHANFIPASVCMNDVVLVDSSYSTGGYQISNWTWDFGDGQTSDQQNPFHIFQDPGTYNISLIVVSAIGCHDTIARMVTIKPVPDAAFALNDICNSDSLHLFDQSTISSGSINQWQWDFGDGSPVETTHNPVHQYPVPGFYTISLIATGSNGCEDTISHSLQVHPSPTPAFSASDVCLNNPVLFNDQSVANSGVITSWIWNFGDNTSDNTQNPVHIYNSALHYQVKLRVSSSNGCSDTLEHTVSVHPIPQSGFNTSVACDGDSSMFTNLSTIAWGTIDSSLWFFGDGSAPSTEINPHHLYSTPGSYQVTLMQTSDFRCIHSYQQTVQVHELPQADFSVDRRYGCKPLPVQFTDISNSTDGLINNWYWNFGDLSPINHTGNPYHVYDRDGVFSIMMIAVTQFGCRDTMIRNGYITVYPKPEAGFSIQPENPTMLNPTVTLFDEYYGATTWVYNFGEGASTTANNPEHTYSAPGIYHLSQIVGNQYQCFDTLERVLDIPDDFTFFIPNSFTPNGDGWNDSFYGFGFHVQSVQMNIFNRWGDMIYETNDMDKPWDGKYKGAPAQSDVYIYKIIATDAFDIEHSYVGDVTLVR